MDSSAHNNGKNNRLYLVMSLQFFSTISFTMQKHLVPLQNLKGQILYIFLL